MKITAKKRSVTTFQSTVLQKIDIVIVSEAKDLCIWHRPERFVGSSPNFLRRFHRHDSCDARHDFFVLL